MKTHYRSALVVAMTASSLLAATTAVRADPAPIPAVTPADAPSGGFNGPLAIDNASPGSPADVAARAPDLATMAPQIGDPIEKMRYGLMADYPEQFGGLVGGADGSISIVEVGRSATFEAAADEEYAKIHTASGRPLPSIYQHAHFVAGSVPFAQLYSMNAQIQAKLFRSGSGGSDGIWSVGIDDASGKIAIVDDGSPSAQTQVAELGNQYGPDLFEVTVGPMPRASDVTRYSDSPPWNGGDDLTNSTYGDGCTSGFPMHNSVGWEFLLTAGHCGPGAFYNTDFTAPSYNSGTSVGSTINGSLSVNNMDEQILAPPSGSSCITWGGLSTSNSNDVRYYNEGYNNPPVGATVDYEGAQGHEITTHVVAYNVAISYSTGLYGTVSVVGTDETDRPNVPGDSGGPAINVSIYGPFAGGSMLAENGVNGWFQLIGGIVYIYSVAYNTSFVPNYVTTSGCVN